MPMVNTKSARSSAVALKAFAATACAAALVLAAAVGLAEAAPMTAMYGAGQNPDVHNVRVIRKVTDGSGRKKVIRSGRLYDKSPKFKQVIVNGKRVPRRVDAPVVRDHRVTGGVSVRDHRTK